ncbi:hypothetical protein DMUE_4414 [Dictyocoela muelleri]|nr:hypothetical protein DMUE_4414 [Dictyocoela muelleri]
MIKIYKINHFKKKGNTKCKSVMFNKDFENKKFINYSNVKRAHQDDKRKHISDNVSNKEIRSIIEYYLRFSRIPPRHVILKINDERDEILIKEKNDINNEFLEVNTIIEGTDLNIKEKIKFIDNIK